MYHPILLILQDGVEENLDRVSDFGNPRPKTYLEFYESSIEKMFLLNYFESVLDLNAAHWSSRTKWGNYCKKKTFSNKRNSQNHKTSCLKHSSSMNLIKEIELILAGYLKDYFSRLHDHVVDSGDNILEINGKKQKDDSGYFILLRLGINEFNKEIYIYNMYLPEEDRGKGVGLGLIGVAFEISQAIKFDLVLADMTDGFRQAMLRRGAVPTSVHDCLQVIEKTMLK